MKNIINRALAAEKKLFTLLLATEIVMIRVLPYKTGCETAIPLSF